MKFFYDGERGWLKGRGEIGALCCEGIEEQKDWGTLKKQENRVKYGGYTPRNRDTAGNT